MTPDAGSHRANRWVVDARLIRQGRTRYTPAGLRVHELGFQFDGAVVEAGSERQLGFEFDAIAVGDVAQRLAQMELGTAVTLSGFLAPTSRRSRRIRLHVTEYGIRLGE